jgi:hypothetical protein
VRPKHAVDLHEDTRLPGREVHRAVGDHHVDAGVGQRDLFEVALEPLDVAHPCGLGVGRGDLQHRGQHVEAERLSGRPDGTGGEDRVDAAAAA